MQPSESVSPIATVDPPPHPLVRAVRAIAYLAQDKSPVFWVPVYSAMVYGLTYLGHPLFRNQNGRELPFVLGFAALWLTLPFIGGVVYTLLAYSVQEFKRALSKVK